LSAFNTSVESVELSLSCRDGEIITLGVTGVLVDNKRGKFDADNVPAEITSSISVG
jgi:hypothetical protein